MANAKPNLNINNQNSTLPMEVNYEVNGEVINLNAKTVRDYLVNGNANVSDQEVVMYMNLCKFQHLNPFTRDCYLIKYSQNNPAQIVVGKEAFLKRAENNKEYEGKEDGIYVITKNGQLIQRKGSLKLPNETLVGAYCIVYRKGFKPTEVAVSYDEYVGRDSNGNINSMWRTKGATMLRKVAICQALREAFPQTYSGMYSEDEIDNSREREYNQETNEKTYDINGVVVEENNSESTVYENNENSNNEYEYEETNLFDNNYQQNEEPVNNTSSEELVMLYSEYKNNKDKYVMVSNSYDSASKTCRVTLKK